MGDAGTGVEEDRAIAGRARFDSRTIDEHRVRKVQRRHVHPAAAQQLLGRLIEVPGVETAGEAAKLATPQGATGSGSILRPKDLRFVQEVPFSAGHLTAFRSSSPG
jgi:hypothetical protein